MARFNTPFFLGFLLLACIVPAPALAADYPCTSPYRIEATLPNGAAWGMCWEHRQQNGITLHHIYYTPKAGQQRMIINQAEVAQVHVPYDDNGARYHDITDYGFGGSNLLSLTEAECPGGTLLTFYAQPIICQQVQPRGEALRNQNKATTGHKLSIFSVSKIGSYRYIPRWEFLDDGSIDISIGATGALQRFGQATANNGWLITPERVGLGHLHNFFWRLDFDLGGDAANDYAEELEFVEKDQGLALQQQRFTSEAARDVSPSTLRSWLIADADLKNAIGHPMAYEVELYQSGQKDKGPDSEPFTHHDIYFTKQKDCERFASRNADMDTCATNLADFIDGETLEGQDIVVWPTTTFYHLPRSEDAPTMDTHWSGIRLRPFDWHDTTPLTGNTQ